MKATDNIKIKAGKFLINKELKSKATRNASVCNIKKANSIGFLLKINEEADLIKILKFEKYLKSEFGVRKVFALGYYDGKEIPNYLKSSLNFDFLTRKDLNWKGVPSGVIFNNFTEEKFDILIDFTSYFNIPLRFALLRSVSKFKVGCFSEENQPYYDFMIDSDCADFEEFANQLVHYLSLINAE